MANERNCDDSLNHQVSQELTSEDKKYAEAYLNETNDTRETAMTEVKRWIEDELHKHIDDFLILRFLRVCKFNLEKTKARIRNYYKQRTDLPEWFTNKNPFQQKIQDILDLGIFLPLRKPDGQGRLVIIIRCTRHDPRIHKVPDLAKVFVSITELAVKYYPAASVYGCTLLVDVINPTIRHMLQYGPYTLMNVTHAFQSCYPMRYQAIDVFNAPTFFDIAVRLFKSFMTEKMKNRYHVYSRNIQCSNDIPINILPVEYGGTNSTCQELTEYWKKEIEENRDWFMRDDNVK